MQTVVHMGSKFPVSSPDFLFIVAILIGGGGCLSVFQGEERVEGLKSKKNGGENKENKSWNLPKLSEHPGSSQTGGDMASWGRGCVGGAGHLALRAGFWECAEPV